MLVLVRVGVEAVAGALDNPVADVVAVAAIVAGIAGIAAVAGRGFAVEGMTS